MYNIIWTEQLISKNTCAYTNAYINVIATDDQRVISLKVSKNVMWENLEGEKKREIW